MIDIAELKRTIDTGKLGVNRGLPHGLSRLVEHVPGIQQGTYYLIAAESNVGKSNFVNNCFVFNPIDWLLANKDRTNSKLKIHYYSFEVAKDMLLFKAVCRRIFLTTGRLLDVNYILSRGRNRISEENYNLVIKSLSYLEPMSDMLDIYDVPDNPENICRTMLKEAKNNGKGFDENLKLVEEYRPYNPEQYNLIVVDHVALLQKAKGFNTKESIDKLSEYLIYLRNKFRYTPVVIQQLNRSNSGASRIKLDKMEPMLTDLRDSSGTAQDCNVCLALFSPARYELPKHRDYKINPNEGGLGHRYRSLSILKNRDGESDKAIGLKFIGECGYFEELPPAPKNNIQKPGDMTLEDYERILSIRKSI